MVIRSVELLSFTPQSTRADAVLQAIGASAPCPTSTRSYRGESDVLVIWGPGDPARFVPMAAQIASGGHVLALDLAYWDRHRKFRVSFDAAHPQRWILRKDWPSSRLLADGIVAESRWNPLGPIVVAGIGRKAKVQYGDAVDRWERQMIATAKARWPDRTIWYRRKRPDAPIPPGVTSAPDAAIEQVLTGASLVVTWHSNVAVDAIRLGIPTVCHDGAAAAVCGSTYPVHEPVPLAPAIRDRFLANLAWFQWAPTEAMQMWAWVEGLFA